MTGYAKAKGRRKHKRRAYAVYHDVVKHPRWVVLSPYAKLIWLEIGLEYNTVNNGWLACPYQYLIKERGFKSRSTIKQGIDELIWYGFLEKIYPGSLPNIPARYALTHLDINQHKDNLVMASKATHDYKKHSGEPFKKRSRKIKSLSPPGDTIGTTGGTIGDTTKNHSPAKWTKEKATIHNLSYEEQEVTPRRGKLANFNT